VIRDEELHDASEYNQKKDAALKKSEKDLMSLINSSNHSKPKDVRSK